jgi:hypothetical protein
MSRLVTELVEEVSRGELHRFATEAKIETASAGETAAPSERRAHVVRARASRSIEHALLFVLQDSRAPPVTSDKTLKK